MTTKDYSTATLWGIHGGRTGDADGIFLKKNQVALGWEAMGDLGALAATRDAFKARLMEAYPDRKPGYYPMATGQLFRFVHEMKDGDLIVYPSKRDKRVHVGEIVGPYQHATICWSWSHLSFSNRGSAGKRWYLKPTSSCWIDSRIYRRKVRNER